MRKWIAVLALGNVLACGSAGSGEPVATDTTTPTIPKVCADGFTDSDTGCEPIHAATACAPGTRDALGSAACVPVGVTACADGFVADSSGWGCAPVVSATACVDGSGTIEHLGSTACEPISDCTAPLPSGLLVDASLDDAAVDATHFKTISAAVAASAPGATIAVEAGTYPEAITLPGHAVTIIGRCAEKTIVTAVSEKTVAFSLVGHDDLTLSKLTLRGHRVGISMVGGKASVDSVAIEDGSFLGISASGGATLTMKNTVIRGTKIIDAEQSMGLFVNDGSTATISDSVFASNEFINVGCSDAGSSMTLSRSVVRDGHAVGSPARYGVGVYATTAANVTIDESAIVDNSASGVDAFSTGAAPATVTLKHSVVRGTKYVKSQNVGSGIEASNSHLVVDESTIAENETLEVMVADGSTLDISNSTLRGKPQASDADHGALGLVTDTGTSNARSIAIVNPRSGVIVQSTGSVTMDSSLVTNTRASAVLYDTDSQYNGLGMIVETPASLTLTKSTIEGAHTAGILTVGKADVSDTLIQQTLAGLDGFGGRGLSVQNGAAATVARSAFVGNMEVGVVLMMENASLTITDSTVKDTSLDANGQFGVGMMLGGDVLATVDHCTVTGSAGVGVMVAAAGAAMRAGTVSNNAIGVNAQDGTTLVVGDEDPDARSFVVSAATKFVGNQTRVGSGAVPLPSPITLTSAR